MAESSARAVVPDEGKAPAATRRKLSRRPVIGWVGGMLATLAIASTVLRPARPLLLWNASSSSPLGLYGVTSAGSIKAGDTVIAWAPAPARRLAAERHYLPANVPLVKRVAAARGDRVCAKRRTIFVNGRPAALRRVRDTSGRQLPWWFGCRRLRPGELFLLSPNSPHAFDGRYFGITRSSEIVGKARLLWHR